MKNPKHIVLTSFTRKRFMEIYQWVQAGRLPAELQQYMTVPIEDIPKKAATKLRQADVLMRFYQHDDTVINRLLADKRWRYVIIRRVGDEETAEMILL